MGLSDITLVIHDFGSVLGYQFTYLYPTLVKRLISMDIGMGMLPKGFPANPTPTINELLGYQSMTRKPRDVEPTTLDVPPMRPNQVYWASPRTEKAYCGKLSRPNPHVRVSMSR